MLQRQVLTCFLPLMGESNVHTTDWLRVSGVWDDDDGLQEAGELKFELELHVIPTALTLDREPHQVHRITKAGVVFYLCDAGGCPGSTLGRGDGWLIVPMSNVLSINFFGRMLTA